jgi:undecaprenyl-diphosphatase
MSPMLKKINELDWHVSTTVAKVRTNSVTIILRAFTYSARGYAWGFYVFLLTIFQQINREVIPGQLVIIQALFCTFMTWLISMIIKKRVKRLRPFQAIHQFPPLVVSPLNDSFPSLHAGSTTAFFVGLLLLHHPWAFWVGGWALIVIFSRLYLGVHYLSDLLGGIALGIGCGYFVFII